MKKLINGVVDELSLLGLDPAVLHDLMQDDSEHSEVSAILRSSPMSIASSQTGEDDETASSVHDSLGSGSSLLQDFPQTATHAVYELHSE